MDGLCCRFSMGPKLLSSTGADESEMVDFCGDTIEKPGSCTLFPGVL